MEVHRRRSAVVVCFVPFAARFILSLEALYSEGSPPIEIADRLFHSMPHILLVNGMAQRATKAVVEDYKYVNTLAWIDSSMTLTFFRETLDKLKDVGFKLNNGINDTGFLLLLKEKGGGHYFGETHTLRSV